MATTSNESAPQYLTKEYVEKVLRNYFKDTTLRVIDIEITPAVAKGESYCSVMTRIKINYKVDGEETINQTNFMAKSNYDDNPDILEILRQYDVCNTEMQMYETVLPQLQHMLSEIGDTDQLNAKTIHVDYDREVIIFEDLSLRNFTTMNRLVGMDEDHIKFCLRKLAKLHATAAVLNERQPGVLEKYTHGIYNRHVDIYGEFVKSELKACSKFVKSCPELGTYYSDKLSKLIPHAVEYITRCYDPHPKHFLTLNHGDMWTNNVMVQYNTVQGERNINDILLIDFQYSCWTSPAVDLHYFFSTSTFDDILLNHKPKFVQYYYNILYETLEKLKYKHKVPTLHELNIQLLERGFYAMSCQLVNFPLLINNKTEDADFNILIGTDEKAQKFHDLLYTNERVQKIVKEMLPRFDRLGLLDVT